jgi:hypothetical protein
MMDGASRDFYTVNLPKTQAGQEARKGFVNHWADSSALWTARRGLGEAVDKMLGLQQSQFSQSASSTRSSLELRKMAEAGMPDAFIKQHKPSLTYSELLRTGTKEVHWKDLSWDTYCSQVKKNTAPLREGLSALHRKDFFKGFRIKDFARYTLWEENARPFKTLFSNSWKNNLFSNLAYTAGVGTMGYTVLSSSRKAYKVGKEKEDGSWASRLDTWQETGIAFLSQLTKSVASWECANIGMALGKMLIPIGTFPIGGIIVGALMGTVAFSILDRFLPSSKKSDERDKTN